MLYPSFPWYYITILLSSALPHVLTAVRLKQLRETASELGAGGLSDAIVISTHP